MIWQQVILLQIIAGSVLTLWSRKISLQYSNYIFSIFLTVYIIVALVGMVLAITVNNGNIPTLPSGVNWAYIALEGILIPLAWLFSYKLLSIIGASSMGIAQSVNFLVAATLGIFILGDPLGWEIIIGAALLLTGVIIVLQLRNPTIKMQNIGILQKFVLLFLSSVALSFGLLFEKLAIDGIGVWGYSFYGWSAQLVGALVLFIIFGRKELKHKFTSNFWKNASIVGLLTSVSGALFIYSLSKGQLSSVVLASSAKIVLTSILAYWILHERNDLQMRFLAMVLAVIGLIVIFST